MEIRKYRLNLADEKKVEHYDSLGIPDQEILWENTILHCDGKFYARAQYLLKLRLMLLEEIEAPIDVTMCLSKDEITCPFCNHGIKECEVEDRNLIVCKRCSAEFRSDEESYGMVNTIIAKGKIEHLLGVDDKIEFNDYRFVGDVTELEKIGYTFHKVYAMEYEAYMLDDITMYVVDKMIVFISNIKMIHQETIIKFILDNKDQPEEFWFRESDLFGPMAKYRLTHSGKIMAYSEWSKLSKDAMAVYLENPDRDEYYQMDGAWDGFIIHLPFVKQILALNDLCPLEVYRNFNNKPL